MTGPKTWSSRVATLLIALLLAALSNSDAAAPATAATPGGETFTLTSTLDTVDESPGDGVCADLHGECTLRAAIMETNELPGRQTLLLPSGDYVLTLDGYEENESERGDLDILDDLSIVGAGVDKTRITEDAFAVDRVFDVRAGVVSIRDLTVHGVFMSAFLSLDETCGGGIRSFADLTISHVVIRDNTFRRAGGGVCNRGGVLRMSDSSIDGNIAALTGPGGGIYNVDGLAILERVIVSSNHGDTTGGGGIANFGTMILRDSLITGNSTGGQADGASGIDNRTQAGELLVINSTISGNLADPLGGSPGGGGVSSKDGASATFINSVIANNESAAQAGGINIRSGLGDTINLINTVVANQ